MHLVQDASLPAHTRNDAHLYKVLFEQDLGNPDGYERWVDKLRPDQLQPLLATAIRPPDAIFTATGSAAAPAPVARLIDSDRYTGANPGVLTDAALGLAEYSNGNFFSDDTIFADKPALVGVIPYPARTSVRLREEPEQVPGTRQRRWYLEKFREGEQVAHIATIGALYGSLPPDLRTENVALDGNVYADYAALLLPRAVGYSAALLDHFFRGRLEVTPEAAPGTAIRVANRTTGEAMAGQLSVYYDMEGGAREQLVSWSFEAAADGEVGPLVIPSPPADKPAAEPGRYLLVYRGPLGAEPDAVVGTWFTVWVAYAGTFSTTSSCTRQPSNQFACAASESGAMGRVTPRADGTVEAGGVSSLFLSYTVGGTLYSGDNPNYFYLNQTESVEATFYVYRTGGGPSMRVTASAPGCVLLWGHLAGEIEPALAGTPPEFEDTVGVTVLDWVGDQPFAVGPGPLLFGFFPPRLYVAPPAGPGTTEGSSSCGVARVQFLPE